ncbi:MAG: hypothetical protein U0136_04845 [Bdellovibrionota bacterium]
MLKRPRLSDILGMILTFVLLYSHGPILGDPGVGWHLRTGEWILKNYAVPRFDPFLESGVTPRVWIHDQWLSDVLFWVLYRAGGWLALELLVCVCCVGCLVVVLGPFVRRYNRSAVLVFCALALCAMVQSVQWFVRPVVISILLFSWVYQLACRWFESEKLSRAETLALPIVFAIWANLHPAFILGLFVLCSAILLSRVSGRKHDDWNFEIAAVLSALATLVTPWGVGLYRSMIALAGSPYFTKLNQEWLSPDLQASAFFGLTIFILLLLGLHYRERGRPLHALDLSLLGLFLFLSLLQRRYLPYFSIVAVGPLLKLLNETSLRGANERRQSELSRAFERISERESNLPHSTWTLSCWVLAAATIIGTRTLPGANPEWDARYLRLPDEMQSALHDGRAAPIFHSPDFGGQLVWDVWPHQHPWIDDRNQLLGVSPYEQWFKMARAEPGWEAAFDAGSFGWVLTERRSALRFILERDNRWRKIADSSEMGIMLFRREE